MFASGRKPPFILVLLASRQRIDEGIAAIAERGTLFLMRDELQTQSKQARAARKQADEHERAEQKRIADLRRECRLATYSKLKLTAAQIAALEWLYEQPNPLENWEIYSALRKAYPTANKFVSALKQPEANTLDDEWLRRHALPDDDFEKLLEDLPSLCHDHEVWKNRFKIEYELQEKRKKKRLCFWWSIIAVVILLVLIIANFG